MSCFAPSKSWSIVPNVLSFFRFFALTGDVESLSYDFSLLGSSAISWVIFWVYLGVVVRVVSLGTRVTVRSGCSFGLSRLANLATFSSGYSIILFNLMLRGVSVCVCIGESLPNGEPPTEFAFLLPSDGSLIWPSDRRFSIGDFYNCLC